MSGPWRTISVALEMNAGRLVVGARQGSQAVRQFGSEVDRTLAANQQKLDHFGQTATRNLTLPMIAGAGVALKLNHDYSTTFQQMQGLAGVAGSEVAGLKKEVQALAIEAGRGPQDVAEGLYYIRSAGFQGAQSMEALERSTKGAAVGLGETQVVADAVTSAMKSYSEEELTAARATDVLVGAVREAKSEANEIAPQLGRLLPVASELGIGFDETAGSLAFLTRGGNDAARASTQLSGIMQKLLGPTRQGRKELEAVGLSSDELRRVVAEDGLLAALQLLDDRLGGNSEKLRRVFDDVEGYTGVLALLNDDGRETAEVIDAVSNSAGALDSAFAQLQQTDEFKARQAFSKLKVAAIVAGGEMTPALAGIASGVGNVAEAFGSLPVPVQQTVLALGAAVALAGPAASSLSALSQAFDFVAGRGGRASQAINGLLRQVVATPGAMAAGAGAAALLVLAYQDIVGSARLAEEQVNSLVDAARAKGTSTVDEFRIKLARTINGLSDGFESGIGEGMSELGWQLEETGISAADLAEGLLGTKEEYGALVDRVKGSPLDDSLVPGFLGRLDELRSHAREADEKAAGYEQTLTDLGVAEDQVGAKADRAADSTSDLATETDRASAASRGYSTTLKDLERQMAELVDLPVGRWDAALSYSRSVDDVAEAIEDLEDARASLRRGSAEDARTFADAQRSAEEAVEASRRSQMDTEERLEELRTRGLRDADDRLDDLRTRGLRDANERIREARAAVGAAKNARDRKRAELDLRSALEAREDLLEDITRAEEARGDVLKDIARTEEDLVRAGEDLARTREEAANVQRDDGSAERADAVKEAENRLTDAMRQQVEQAVAQRKAEAELNGERFTAKDSNAAYREELAKLIAMLEPGDPLRQNLQGLYYDLENINREFTAKVTIGVSIGELKAPPKTPFEMLERLAAGLFGGGGAEVPAGSPGAVIAGLSLPTFRRWGGIHETARNGRLPATIVNDPTILFGERETGGEAMVPRIGNPARSLAILRQAASWYGHEVIPMASGGVTATDQAVAANLSDWHVQTTDEAERWADDVETLLDDTARSVGSSLADIMSMSRSEIDDLGLSTLRTIAGMLDNAKRLGTTGMRDFTAAVAFVLAAGAGRVGSIAGDYTMGLAKSINPVLVATGQPKVTFRNAGGFIPGPNVDRDVVPAMLTPGEYVIRKEAAKRLGFEALNALNAGRVPDGWAAYNRGGVVTGDIEGMHPVLLSRLQAWSAAVGLPYDVRSGYRSVEEQQRLRDAYLAGRGPLAALPGSSMHNYGLASDGPHWGAKNPGRFGLVFNVPGEAWHVQPVEARQLRGVSAHGLPTPGIPGPPSIGSWPVASAAEGAMGMAYRAALAGVQGMSVDARVPAIADTDLKETVQAMAAARGWVGAQWDALHELVQRESSWRPTAQNPTSTAFGLFQFLDSTWGGVGGRKTSDPIEQARLGLEYIAQRYGDPVSALAFHDRNNWYNAGGEVTVHGRTFDRGGRFEDGWNLAYNATGGPEYLTPTQPYIDAPAGAGVAATVVEIGDLLIDARFVLEDGSFVRIARAEAELVVAEDRRQQVRVNRTMGRGVR